MTAWTRADRTAASPSRLALSRHRFAAYGLDRLSVARRGLSKRSRHRGQWTYTLTELAKPLRSMPVDQIETRDVLEVLKPLWQDIPETASRLRGRIEAVLNAAKAKGYRSGENPARWRGHLDQLLPKRQRLTRGHHAALPYDKLPEFMAKLRDGLDSVTSLALEFTILTAARTTPHSGCGSECAREDSTVQMSRCWLT